MSIKAVNFVVIVLLTGAVAQNIAGSGGQIIGKLTASVKLWLANSSNIDTLRNVILHPSDAVSGLASSQQALAMLTQVQQDVGTECLQHMVVFGQALALQEDWALKMVDAIGKPPAGLLGKKILWMGDWGECTGTQATVYDNATLKSNPTHPFSGQYCSVKFPLKGSGSITAFSKAGFTIGTCFPSSCSSSDATVLARLLVHLLSNNGSNLGNFTIPDPSVTCQEKDIPLENDAIIVIVVCAVFATIMVIATLYDVVYVHWLAVSGKPHPKSDVVEQKIKPEMTGVYTIQYEPELDKPPTENGKPTTENGIISTEEQSVTGELEAEKGKQEISKLSKNNAGVLEGVLLSFSMYTNGCKILNTNQPKGALTAVNGIRFLSMTWVVIGHGFGQIVGPWTDNAMQYAFGLVKRKEFTAIWNGTFSVDTFFLLSGLLVSYLSLKEMKKCKGAKKFKWGMYYFHRFWRLTPPYMLLVMIWVAFSRYFANGPLWPQNGFDDANACKKMWWVNLLYINNFVKPTDFESNACFGWAWYLANDMQFYVISPLALIPLYYSPILGGLACLALLLTSTISSGMVTWHYNLPPFTVFATDPEVADNNQWLFYVKPWCRVGPYAVGLFTGYMLYRTKLKMKINSYINVLLWAVSITLGCLLVYGIYTDDNTSPLSPSVTALYNATARSVWGACVAWVIFACANGYGGPVNRILSWPAFVPLGRLTYFAYLCHIILQEIYTKSQLSVTTAYDYGVVYVVLGHLVVAYAASFVLSLAFEAPMMGLEKVLLGRDKHS